MVNNGCWDEFMGCHEMMHHACIMQHACHGHVHDTCNRRRDHGRVKGHGMTWNRGKMHITEKDTLGFLTHPSMQHCVAHVRSTVLP